MDIDQENKTLFSKSINVNFKRTGSKIIDVLIQSRVSKTYHRKELFVQLTNQENFFFLQTLTISEEDFKSLKQEQGLLVDFDAFGRQFIDLLENCSAEESSTNPRFIVQFTSGDDSTISYSTLEIIETNPFKHLIHLSLKFVPGNDVEIKNYLVNCLKTIKDEKIATEKKLVDTETDLSLKLRNAEKLLAENSEKFHAVKENSNKQHGNTVQFYETELLKLRETSEKLSQDTEKRINATRNNLEERYSTQIMDLEQRLKEKELLNKDLTDQKYRHEAIIREMRTKISSLEQERNLVTRDIHALRRQNTNLDSDKHERDKTLNHLRTRIAVLEQEVNNQEHLLQKSNDLLETSQEQKTRLQIDLDNQTNQSKQLEEHVKTLSAEVNKGNDIIQKLQENLRSLKSRVKVLSVVTTKQEKVIEDKESLLSNKENELEKDKTCLKQVEENIKEERNKNKELSQKLKDAQEEMKNNENVINWLNRQLTENSIQRQSSYNTSNSINNATSSARISYNRKLNVGLPEYPMQQQTRLPLQMNTKTSPLFNQGLHPSVTSIQSQYANHPPVNLHERPILKKPQHFQPDGISPIVPYVTKQPLREKQLHFSTPAAADDPILDPKYLMRKKPAPVEVKDDLPNPPSSNNENINSAVQLKTVKPFPVNSANLVK